jgi:hypothetical protein
MPRKCGQPARCQLHQLAPLYIPEIQDRTHIMFERCLCTSSECIFVGVSWLESSRGPAGKNKISVNFFKFDSVRCGVEKMFHHHYVTADHYSSSPYGAMPRSVYASHDSGMVRAMGTPTMNWGQPQMMQHSTPTCETYFLPGPPPPAPPSQDFQYQVQPQQIMKPMKNSRLAPPVSKAEACFSSTIFVYGDSRVGSVLALSLHISMNWSICLT